MQTLLRTPLFERHVALGARMVPFAGYEMPVQYEGVIPEHKAVRSDAGAFDVSHMGEIHVDVSRRQAKAARAHWGSRYDNALDAARDQLKALGGDEGYANYFAFAFKG
jgi:glycine cleavage system aminomethyltransferase T